MATLQPATGDVAALDRGLVEIGLIAARALARVDELTTRLAAHERALKLAMDCAAGVHPDPAPGRHLRLVR